MICSTENRARTGEMLRFSRRGERSRNVRAFTLLELMIVVAVMGIILMMGIPAIRSAMQHDPMTQAVVDFTTACQGGTGHQGARSLAIMNGRTMEMRIYPAERRIEVGEVSSTDNGGSSDSSEPAADGTPAPKPAGAFAPFSAQISDRVSFRMLDVNFIDCRNADYATVRFYPNGTSDEFNVILVSDSGEARRITLDIVTGLPEVTNLE